jgi:hypothetical protein
MALLFPKPFNDRFKTINHFIHCFTRHTRNSKMYEYVISRVENLRKSRNAYSLYCMTCITWKVLLPRTCDHVKFKLDLRIDLRRDGLNHVLTRRAPDARFFHVSSFFFFPFFFQKQKDEMESMIFGLADSRTSNMWQGVKDLKRFGKTTAVEVQVIIIFFFFHLSFYSFLKLLAVPVS